MAPGRKPLKKKLPEEKAGKNVFDFTQEDEGKNLSGTEDDIRQGMVREGDKFVTDIEISVSMARMTKATFSLER